MKIYSMTATFGKLNHETLTLKPGLNVIEAPNEWGKSTWCAFLQAMLYGIDTSSRSKKDFLADKERYAPWSGAPMSGRMDICWQGRDITIERSTKGRSQFGVFKAYETQSGVAVPELNAANCGQMLLGVEQSVFARAGFVRLKDMPVTQDESLRRRLNSLVTTGDESDSSDDLSQKLRDLKNRCRFNRSGLLPQAETQRREIAGKLEELESLQRQVKSVENRQAELKQYQDQLQNHKKALEYEADRNFAGKMAMAKAQLEVAQERVEALESVCHALQSPQMLQLKKLQIQQLTQKKEALQMELQLQPPPPELPEMAPQFRGMAPNEAVRQVQEDMDQYDAMLGSTRTPSPVLWLAGAALTVAGILLVGKYIGIILMILGALVTVLGVVLQINRRSQNRNLQMQAQMIARRYAPLQREQWLEGAVAYAQSMEDYEKQQQDYRSQLRELDVRMKDILNQLEAMTDGKTAVRYEQELDAALQQHRAYADALRERGRMEELVATLEQTHTQVQPPESPDELTFDMPQTDRLLSDVTAEIRQLHQRLGQCQGRMEALGNADVLREQLQKADQRIGELEKVYAAAGLAQQMLQEAKQELQRRFAPRIAQRAQTLFGKLTAERYQRIHIGEDFALSTAAEGEDTLRGGLWRSDGTADQMYLALRLAVAEELTPEAPLVLDDAFVRFDDDRLKEALKILHETGRDKQVILFTCQSRERKIMEELS